MSAPFHAFHWPDHVIGKRESRRIRNDHNALFNSHAELRTALSELVFLTEGLAGLDETQLKAIEIARAAIAKAEGRT